MWTAEYSHYEKELKEGKERSTIPCQDNMTAQGTSRRDGIYKDIQMQNKPQPLFQIFEENKDDCDDTDFL